MNSREAEKLLQRGDWEAVRDRVEYLMGRARLWFRTTHTCRHAAVSAHGAEAANLVRLMTPPTYQPDPLGGSVISSQDVLLLYVRALRQARCDWFAWLAQSVGTEAEIRGEKGESYLVFRSGDSSWAFVHEDGEVQINGTCPTLPVVKPKPGRESTGDVTNVEVVGGLDGEADPESEPLRVVLTVLDSISIAPAIVESGLVSSISEVLRLLHSGAVLVNDVKVDRYAQLSAGGRFDVRVGKRRRAILEVEEFASAQELALEVNRPI